MAEDEGDFQDLAEIISKNLRGAQDYWYWRDKDIMEVGVAKQVLELAGLPITKLRTRGSGNDPPDCEGYLNDELCGVEISELVHEKTLKATIKGNPQYFLWDRSSLVGAIQARITRKDRVRSIKGGPYARYILILVTDEMTLGREDVARFLEGAVFYKRKVITDAVLGLSYDPSIRTCPVFVLPLEVGNSL